MSETILTRLEGHARARPDDPADFRKIDGVWSPRSWAELRDDVEAVARAFTDLGVGPGRSVGILGFNRPEWTTSALAAMAAGGAAAGIYTTNAPAQVEHVLAHADAAVAVVENAEQWHKVAAVRRRLPGLARVVVMDTRGLPAEAAADAGTVPWPALLAAGRDLAPDALAARGHGIRGETLASLIYTSGTTGPPKGVMLSHDNLLETATICGELLDATPADRALSYLPLAHIAEQMLSIHVPVTRGYPIYYAQALETLLDDLRETRPTLFFAVPRVWERIHAGLEGRLAAAGAGKRALFDWATAVGRRAAARRNAGDRPRGVLALAERVADRLVIGKAKRALGFDAVRVCASGAAPIAVEVLSFFAGLGLVIHEVYGQSEGCGPTTWNRPGRTRFGTVGPPIPRVEVRLAEDGEVLVRGPNVFLGYRRDPVATAEALDADGWLHSGDLGAFDPDGMLRIVGRKKEIMITSGGKNIAPNAIEGALEKLELVADAVLIADGRKFVSVLLALDPDAAGRLAAELGVEPAAIAAHEETLRRLAAGVEAVNRELSRVEQVKAFRVLPRPLSIADGDLTPTMKIKRRAVEAAFADLIESMYSP